MAKAIDLTLLDGTNGFTLNGIDRRDASGYSVSSAGDVNGDGYDDLIIGAYGADPNGVDSGETYVVYGRTSAPGTDGGASASGTNGVLALSALDGTNGFTLTGIDPGDASGFSVSSAGDVNGDGYDDLIIGAYGADPDGEGSDETGETYVVYGGASAPGTDGVLALSALDGTNGFTLTGIDPADASGVSVSSAGDVNGDGYDDLIIGARRADPNGERSGETYVVYGGASAPGTDGVLDLSALDGTNGFTLNGIDSGDVSGYSVSSAGDVNGDGYDDLIIGARGADPNGARSGETYVVYGGASAPGADGALDLSALNGANGFTLTGIDPDDRSGRSVSSAGDVNGDGYDDLIIGAHRADPNGASSGETYVVYGGASAPGTDGVLALSALDGTNGFTLTGIDPDDESGRSVSSAGDVNGDGYDDLIIGARFADPDGESDAGESYVVFGGASTPGTDGVLALSALDGTNGLTLTGVDPGDRSGVSVSSAGDVNGDGYDDLIIGVPGAEPNGTRSGETYVVYGGSTGTESIVPVTVQGTASVDNFTGNAGADTFTGIATDDVVRGGAGDDSISVTSLDFAHIDGGTGRDTLVLAGSGLSLDLTGAGTAGVDSVEIFDLSGTGADTLVLDALAVFDVTEERDDGMASLDVRGDADDSVELKGFVLNNTETEDGTTYNAYRDGNAEVRVQDGVSVTLSQVFTSPREVSVLENLSVQSVAYTAMADDADDDPLTYSLSGTDADRFTINPGTGEVRFSAVPDYENPADDDGDNVYDVTVTASDGECSTDHAVAITVTDENEPPVFDSPNSASVEENLSVGSAAYTAVARDPEGAALTYGLSGTDADDFTIDAVTGEVRFRVVPNFEAAADADEDNVYDVTVTASDGDGSDRKITGHAVAITVTDENEPPVFDSPNSASVGENLSVGSAAYTAVARDPEGDALIYGLSGTDADRFTINPGTGKVHFNVVPDYENPADDDKDNVYDVTVTASDGDGGDRKITGHAVAITVTDENEPPVFDSPNSASVGENLSVGSAAYTAVARDPEGDALTYGLSGTDADRFTINPGTGKVHFNVVPDYENPADDDKDNVYDVTVTASDGDGTDSKSTHHTVAITVTDENEPPVFDSPNSAIVPENLSVQSVVYTAVASDPEGEALSYSLSGTDADDFTIDAVTGEVRFRVVPNFEAAADADEDNVYQVTVTASDGDGKITEHAVAITVTDEIDDGRFTLSMLDGTNGFTLTGIDQDDDSGHSVSSAGDVNGDGYDDLIIGAHKADPNGTRSGETYVVYGGASAPGTDGVLALSALDGTNGFILTGIDRGDRSGVSVSSAGDVNGDGYDDLIVGARGADPNGESGGGETYVVYGGASAPGADGVFDLSALDGTNGFILTGIDQSDFSGFSVSSAGDVNGDGYDDLIIGAYGADPNGESGSGETYVVYGGASAPGADGVFDLSALDGTNGFILTGIDPDDVSGGSVSAAGDVNGDGYDDLIIGARGADPNGTGSGETYVVYGGASVSGANGVLALSALDGTNGFTLTGIDPDDESGFSVSSAGDVNGDGYGDLIIGAAGAGPNGEAASGETYVVYGGASAPGTDGVLALSALDGTNGFTLTGIDPDDRSGRSVSSAGDVNGDGYDDLIIGAHRADPNGARSGETHVVYGGASAPGTDGVLALSALDGTNGFTLTGIDADDQSGRSVSSAGDVNDDGYDDLIIGARGADPNGLDSGETYVVYGGATGTESTVPVTAQGTVSADNFTGNAGADTFTEIATDDVVRGGAGDDRISVTSVDFAHIDGGTGRDTLVLAGSDLSLDLTGARTAGVHSVEVFDLSGTGADRLVLDALAVFDLTEERDGGMAILDVLGDAGDTVDLSGGKFIAGSAETEDGTTYGVYRDGNAEVRVQDGVIVTLAASGLQRDLDMIQQDMEMFTTLDTDMDGS